MPMNTLGFFAISRIIAVLGFGLVAGFPQITIASASTALVSNGLPEKVNFQMSSEAANAVLRLDDSGQNLVILVDGVASYAWPFANVSELTIDGSARDNTLRVDFSFGNPIPLGGLNYNGGDQETATGDALAMIGAGPMSTQYVPTVLAAGILELSSGKEGVPASIIRFTGLEPIIDTVPGSLTVNSTDGSDSISLANGGTVPRLRVTVNAFEYIEFDNKTSLVVNAGNGVAGNDAGDTINVNFSNAPASLTSITLNGDEGDDVFNLLQAAATISLTVNGGSEANIVRPGGTSPGIFTPGTFTLNSATLEVDLNGTTAGTGYDQIQAPSVTLSGAALSINVGTTLSTGDQFTIIDNAGVGAVNGTFTGLAEGAVFAAGGRNLKITYVGGTGNDVVLSVEPLPPTEPVPALNEWMLVLLSLLLFVIGIQRVQRKL